jgi:hypothetical protein
LNELERLARGGQQQQRLARQILDREEARQGLAQPVEVAAAPVVGDPQASARDVAAAPSQVVHGEELQDASLPPEKLIEHARRRKRLAQNASSLEQQPLGAGAGAAQL